MTEQEYLEKLRAVIREGREVRKYDPPSYRSIVEIDQGGNPKDGILAIDGKVVTFLQKFSLSLDMNGLVSLRIERLLPGNEHINAVLHDVDVEIKTICMHCGSEKIERK